jgi:hypothetical protein
MARHAQRCRDLAVGLGLCVIASIPGTAPAAADTLAPNLVTALLREGQLGETGSPIGSLETISVNHTGGYAVQAVWDHPLGPARGFWGSLQGEPGHWLTPASVMRRALEDGFGLGDAGELCYSQTTAIGRTVWLDDDPVVVPGTTCPSVPSFYHWDFASWARIIPGTGEPHYSGRLNYPALNGHFSGLNGTNPIVLGGQSIPGVPGTVDAQSPVFARGFSALGNHVLLNVFADTYTMVKDGAGLVLGGTLVRQGNVIPASVGGDGAEAWGLPFGEPRINEAGDYLFTSSVDPWPVGDQLFVRNGQILYREGSLVGGEILTGEIPGGSGALNEDGDFALRWAIEDAVPRPVVLFNDRIVARAGDAVDLDGDGLPDPGATLAAFVGTDALPRIGMSDRDGGGDVTIYFLAEVDTAGTPSGDDDLESFLALRIPEPTSVAEVAVVDRGRALRQNRPNPFTGTTEIRFSLERPAAARLTVFDVAGRRIAVLVDGVLPAGSHAVTWSGRSDRGAGTPGGVYFYRLETDEGPETRKMIRFGPE